MRDSELAQQMMLTTFSSFPCNASISVLKEFLLGMSFASQKDFGDESARKLELFIPSTTLSELSSSHLTHTSNLASVSVMAGQQSSYVPGTKILIKDRMNKEFQHETMCIPSKTINRESAMKRTSSFIWGVANQQSSNPPSNANVPQCCATFKNDLATLVEAHVVSQGICPKDSKQILPQWALAYAEANQNAPKTLLDLLLSCYPDPINHPQRNVLFQLLQNYHTTIEDLYLPFPENFHLIFAQLAYHCLPNSVFLQHLSYGLVVVTLEFAKYLLQVKAHPSLLYRALAFLPREHSLLLLSQQEEFVPHLIHYFLAANPRLMSLPSDETAINMTDNSPFQPQTLLSTLFSFNTRTLDLPLCQSLRQSLSVQCCPPSLCSVNPNLEQIEKDDGNQSSFSQQVDFSSSPQDGEIDEE
eukprot:TRINITY_DN6843_c0_g1_i1.p1 TRINITY_DN6843_c0_g1~~TRINITY_DN6843_c0_g1_i1.p1  ORF type:complete len:415 (+),score=110.17 TRINITY_DN6843_c0_g1_i1:194-1438(+)